MKKSDSVLGTSDAPLPAWSHVLALNNSSVLVGRYLCGGALARRTSARCHFHGRHVGM